MPADRAELDGQEVEEERAVGLGGQREHLALVLDGQLLVDPLQVGRLPAQAGAVVDDLGRQLLGRVVEEDHALSGFYGPASSGQTAGPCRVPVNVLRARLHPAVCATRCARSFRIGVTEGDSMILALALRRCPGRFARDHARLPPPTRGPVVVIETSIGRITHRPRARQGADLGQELPRLRARRPLRRHHLPPRDPGLHGPGRRLRRRT